MEAEFVILKIEGKQLERLDFLIDTFYPEIRKESPVRKLMQRRQAIKNLLNDGLHSFYKETLSNINQGNEHDGLPLIKEIND